MATSLPFLTEADPELAGEGSLDPLGLAGTAERLAELVSPGITNRMSRIRFVTATAVAASVTEPLTDVVPADGRTAPYLAFEWHVVLALARDGGLDASATSSVPGIEKARACLRRGGKLDAASYLKMPTVFGFVGVYKRLARATGVVDETLFLQRGGDALLRAWERESGLEGFVDRERGTHGRNVAKDFEAAVTEALVTGHVGRAISSHLWSRLVAGLRPDAAGVREKRVLRDLLLDDQEPLRRELIQRVSRARAAMEPDVIRELALTASEPLAERLAAIDAYEAVAALLVAAFDSIRRRSTLAGARSISSVELALDDVIRHAAGQLPAAIEHAALKLDQVGVETWMETLIGQFGARVDAEAFVEQLLDHHVRVQAAKPPGKRPWFELDDRGLTVRIQYRLAEDVATPDGRYVHPYRVGAVRSLLSEL